MFKLLPVLLLSIAVSEAIGDASCSASSESAQTRAALLQADHAKFEKKALEPRRVTPTLNGSSNHSPSDSIRSAADDTNMTHTLYVNAPVREVYTSDAAPTVAKETQVVNGSSYFIRAMAGVDPAGTSAPLTEEGYVGVSSCCCTGEMKAFIERVAHHEGYDVCDSGGLSGIVKYHTCHEGPQTFAQLVENIKTDAGGRCAWLAKLGNCKPTPDDCGSFPGQPPEDCGCSKSKSFQMNFGGAVLTHNNLGGAGPDSGDQSIIFQHIGNYEGQDLDLVITTTSAYTAEQSSAEGPNGKMDDWGGRVRMKAGETLDLTFTFVQTGTTNQVVLKEALLSIFDLDGKPTISGDEMTFSTIGGYVTDEKPLYNVRRQPDGTTVFASQTNEGKPYGHGDHIPDPVNPMALTKEQRQVSVMLVLRETASVSFQWRILPLENAQTSHHWLFFSGASSLIDRCED